MKIESYRDPRLYAIAIVAIICGKASSRWCRRS